MEANNMLNNAVDFVLRSASYSAKPQIVDLYCSIVAEMISVGRYDT